MKKLMIATAIALMAIASQAATASWKVTAGNLYNSTASSVKYSGTAYIYDSGSISMAALFAAVDAATTASYNFAGTAAGTVTIANGSVASTGNTFSYGESGNNYSFYLVVVEGDNLYFSNEKADLSAANPPAVGTIGFASQNNSTTTFSNLAPADGFQGAGKWSTVPEPTSGLLLLLGMAGLALRRKVA